MKAAPPAPATARTGPCGGWRFTGHCPCRHVNGVMPVGLYPTCSCGHSVAIHALEEVPA